MKYKLAALDIKIRPSKARN